ncbi:MAG: c-type cytochrome [Halioglobus sp.]|nr:c-type cytochrome [Halioglobus sp.]
MLRRSLITLAAVVAVLAGVHNARAATDAAALGRKQFAKCAACHSLQEGAHLMGPSLAGLQGRQVGRVEGFLFSPALEGSTAVWDRETLSAFLENPAGYLPGTVMPFGGLRDQAQREALIDYLFSESGAGS